MPRKAHAKKGAAPQLRSGFEKKVKASLDKQKVEYGYECENIAYNVPASKHRYTPDFTLANGIVLEAKGKFDAAARKKMALVIEQNPDRDIRMLFMRMNKITKSSKTTYGDWCDKRGIVWAVSATGEVPEAWVARPNKRKPKKND